MSGYWRYILWFFNIAPETMADDISTYMNMTIYGTKTWTVSSSFSTLQCRFPQSWGTPWYHRLGSSLINQPANRSPPIDLFRQGAALQVTLLLRVSPDPEMVAVE